MMVEPVSGQLHGEFQMPVKPTIFRCRKLLGTRLAGPSGTILLRRDIHD